MFVMNLPAASRGVSCVKLLMNGFDFIFLDGIYRIDEIVIAFGEEPFRPKAFLSR
jgi:hypothetical protein